MRPFIIIIFLLFSLTISAQKYSKIIKDTTIINFMTWLFKNDTSFKAVRHVDNDIIKLDAENFKYKDTSKINNFLGNIFASNNHIDTIVDEKDSKFFVEQIINQRISKWNLKLKNIQLINEVQLDKNNRTDKVIYSYSLPLFSVDMRHVIIIQGFFCGLLCGGGEYSLYEKQNSGSWTKIKKFNTWAE